MFLAYPSYTEIQHIMSNIDIETTCLKKLFVTLEMIKTHTVNGLVFVGYNFRGFRGGSYPRIQVPTKQHFSV